VRKHRIVKVAVVCALATLACGCAMLGMGPTDEESVAGVIEGLKAATVAQDLDGIMAAYSDDYEGRRGEGKEEMRERTSRRIEEGRFGNAEIRLDEMQVTIDGDTAVAGPVEMETSRGPWRFYYDLTKDAKGQWGIVGRHREEE
jgi:ketosteroid isomerase-like protein